MRRTTFKRHAGLVVIAVGLLFLGSGFIYDTLFAGIPYQDPPPLLQQQYAANAAMAQMLSALGWSIILLGIMIVLIHWIRRRSRA